MPRILLIWSNPSRERDGLETPPQKLEDHLEFESRWRCISATTRPFRGHGLRQTDPGTVHNIDGGKLMQHRQWQRRCLPKDLHRQGKHPLTKRQRRALNAIMQALNADIHPKPLGTKLSQIIS
jgi:hypothetical protein